MWKSIFNTCACHPAAFKAHLRLTLRTSLNSRFASKRKKIKKTICVFSSSFLFRDCALAFPFFFICFFFFPFCFFFSPSWCPSLKSPAYHSSAAFAPFTVITVITIIVEQYFLLCVCVCVDFLLLLFQRPNFCFLLVSVFFFFRYFFYIYSAFFLFLESLPFPFLFVFLFLLLLSLERHLDFSLLLVWRAFTLCRDFTHFLFSPLFFFFLPKSHLFTLLFFFFLCVCV